MVANAFLALVAAALPLALAQGGQTHNLTPDGYWHNRYHALLAMAAYGDYDQTCPAETFTLESRNRNFPNSPYPPWDVISTFGPTANGCAGFTAIVPEMNKALIVFKGDYGIEQTLAADVVPWSYINEALGNACPGCTVNKKAADAYNECVAETNNFQAIRDAYYGHGLVFSITGHGFGGMLSLINSVDFNNQQIAYYSHNYGTPRTFNQAGADHYNWMFNGEAGERGVSQNDLYTEYFPASDNYAHAGTTFHYYGLNYSSLGMNWRICWESDSAACQPQQYGSSTPIEDHYFYFTNVGLCGGTSDPYYYTQGTQQIDQWVASQAYNQQQQQISASASSASVASVSAASASSVASVSSVDSQSAALAAFSATATPQSNAKSGAAQTLPAIFSAVGLLLGVLVMTV